MLTVGKKLILLFYNMIDWSKISTIEILEELLKRDSEGDKYFHKMSESITSYTFKFWKFR